MSFKPAFLFAFAALAGVALVSTSCAPSASAVAEREIEAFAARRAQGDLDGALAALSGCARNVSNSVAILRAARVAEDFGLAGSPYDAARARAGADFAARLLQARVLVPAAEDVLRVRAFAALLRQDALADALPFLAACSRAPAVSADLVGEVEAHLRRTDADKSPEAESRRLAFLNAVLAQNVLVPASADLLRARVFDALMRRKDLDAALALLAACGKTPALVRTVRRAVSAHVRACDAAAVAPTLEKLFACAWFRPADDIGQLVEDQFIRFAGDGAAKPADVPRLKALLALSSTLLAAPSLLSPDAADALRERRLDGFFLSNDFDGAIACLEQGGFKNRSAAWCAGTAAKLRAHKALEAGDKKEAVKQFLAFGAFMLSDEQKDFEDCDPTTGIVYSRDWVVARNLVRCAALSRALGDAQQADAYLADARPRFATAHEKAKDDAKSLDALRAEMKAAGLEPPALPARAKDKEKKAPAAP